METIQISEIETLSTDLSTSTNLFMVDNNEGGTFKTRSVSFETLKNSINQGSSYSSNSGFYGGKCYNYYIKSYFGGGRYIYSNPTVQNLNDEEKQKLDELIDNSTGIKSLQKIDIELSSDCEVQFRYHTPNVSDEDFLIRKQIFVFINEIPSENKLIGYIDGSVSQIECEIYGYTLDKEFDILGDITYSLKDDSCDKGIYHFQVPSTSKSKHNFKKGTKIIIITPKSMNSDSIYNDFSMYITCKELI